MQKKNLLYVLAALMFILLASQLAQTQSTPEIPLKKKTCGDLWPVEQGNKWGYIDKTGRLIIPFKFDDASEFSEGLAAVSIKEKTGYIDTTGKIVIPPRFISGFRFSEGLAAVLIRPVGQQETTSFFNYAYIDKSGKIVMQPPQNPQSLKWFSYAHKGLAFSEGLACVEQNDKSGFINKSGKQVIPPRYDDAQSFSEGLAAVKIKDKYGYIDRTGKMVIPPQFMDAGPFSEGLASITANGKQWSYIDKSGKLVIKGEGFVVARGFSEGLAAVMGKDDKYGYIDKTGKFVIPPRFKRVGDFSEGFAPVMPLGAGWPGDLAYINQRGQMVIPAMSTLRDRPAKAEFDLHYYRFCGGVARVSLGKDEDSDAEGYLNQEGKFIWPEVTPSKQELR